MDKKFLKAIALGCAVFMLFLMAACGGSQTSSDKAPADNKPADNASADKPADAKATGGEIEFWSVFTGPDGTFMQKMIDEYNKTNPAMKVVHRPTEANDLYAKIPTMVASGKNIPDLVINHVERLPLYVEQGILTPLDDYIAKNGKIKAENYVKTAWDMSTIGGKHYAVPLDVHSFNMYINVDLVTKYAPELLDKKSITFDDIKKAALAAKADGITGVGVTWMRVLYLSWLADVGGSLSADGTNPSFADDKSVKALQTFVDFCKDGITTQDGDDAQQLFKSGKLIFWPEGIWMRSGLDEIKGLNYKMTNVPSFDGTNVNNWTSSHQIVMLKNPAMNDERANAALDFIAWIGENSIEWARSGQNPASLKIMDNEEYKKMPQSFLLGEQETLKIYDYKYYGFAVEALDKVLNDMVYGKIGIKEGLDQAQKETADRIKAGN